MANHFNIPALNSMKRQKVMTLKDKPTRLVRVQYTNGEKQRNSYGKKEEVEQKRKPHMAVVVSGGKSKIQCFEEQYYIGTWHVGFVSQGKLEVVKQEMVRMNTNILGISELKLTGMGEFNSDDRYIYYCEQESLRRNAIAIIVNKRVQNAVLGCILRNNKMILVCFKGKPFNITVIQVYAPINNAKEAEFEWFYEDLQDLLELTPKKRCSFHHRGLQCKSRKSRDTWSDK